MRRLPALLPILIASWLAFGAVMSAQPAQAADASRYGNPSSDAFWYGIAEDGGPSVRLHYFYSPTCPHCQAAGPFLDELKSRNPWLEVLRYSVSNDRDNARFYYATAKSLGVEALSVPGFVFCREVRIGYDAADTTGAELEGALLACRERRATSPPAVSSVDATDPPAVANSAGFATGEASAELPWFGRVEAGSLSLPILTVVLAGVDAFNPCAFFVLLFLLSLLVHAKSRARMLLVGGTFVLFSGLVYFVFMAAWLNVFLVAGELRVMTLAAGLLAITVGLLNVKDYFVPGQGPTLSIPDSAKPGLFRRMRELVAGGSVLPMLASTVVLAVVANSYELLCTAGFPMVYTRALTLAGLEPWQYYAWLAAYNLIYVLPLLAIVLVFTWTLGQRKLSEAEGRTLKLVSGYMMLGFGLVLLLAPASLTSAGSSILVLGAALLLALLTRRIRSPVTADAR